MKRIKRIIVNRAVAYDAEREQTRPVKLKNADWFIQKKEYIGLPLEYPANKSLSWLVGPHTSTAETRTENLAPVFCFCSFIPLNSHEIAQGMIPKVFALSGMPSIVYDLPAKRMEKKNA